MAAPEFELLEKRNRTLTLITLVSFLIVAGVFLFFAERYEKNPLITERGVESALDFKLSSDDLVALDRTYDKDRWINVGLIENKRQILPVKLKHKVGSIFDFQLQIEGTIYSLFRYDEKRKPVYNLYQQAGTWGLNGTRPRLVRIRINEILVGIYIMERHIYEQIRDNRGNFFIRLGGNSEALRSLLHSVTLEEIGPSAASRHFDIDRLASAMVFFSLFCRDEVLDFDLLVLYYDSRLEKFLPFLSLESILSTLEPQNRDFKPLDDEDRVLKTGPSAKQIRRLLNRSGYYKYEDLMNVALDGKLRRLGSMGS